MNNKIIKLSERSNIVENKGVKYSHLLEKFIEPFVRDFEHAEFYDDIFEFAINAWNSANIKTLLPEKEDEHAFDALLENGIDIVLLNKMMDYKIKHFNDYTNFIVDYELVKTNEDPVLKITTQEQDAYLQMMLENFDADDSESDFQKGYINRSAIVIKPRKPYLDWCLNLYPEDEFKSKESNVYLISEAIEDIDQWLAKKFDKLFMMELEAWHTNKKNWPQKRNFKMFKEWFQIDVASMIYDFEMTPIHKE